MTGGQVGGLLSFGSEILDASQNKLGLVALGIYERCTPYLVEQILYTACYSPE